MGRQKSIQNIKDFDSRISSFVLYVRHPIAEECQFFQVHKEYFKISHIQDTKLISNLKRLKSFNACSLTTIGNKLEFKNKKIPEVSTI